MTIVTWLYKFAPLLYILVIFLMGAHFVGHAFLYVVMGLSAIAIIPYVLLMPRLFLKKYFFIFLFINVLDIVYLIAFHQTQESLLYTIARFLTFSIIMISVYRFKDFYICNYARYLLYILIVFLFLGFLFPFVGTSDRYSGVFSNPNSLGITATLVFGLIYLKERYTLFDLGILIMSLMLVLLSGSRNAFLGILIAYFLKSPFSMKNLLKVLMGISILIGSYFAVSSYLGMKNTAVDRILYAEKQHKVLSGREKEFEYGYETVLLSPWIGNGLDRTAYISPKVVPSYLIREEFALNPHNSIIGLWNQYGIPVGTLVFFLIFYYVFSMYLWKDKDKSLFFVVAYLFIASLFESMLSSINAFEGMIFWSAMAVNLIAWYSKKSCYGQAIDKLRR